MVFHPCLSIRETPFNHGSNQMSVLSPLTIFLPINPLHHYLALKMVFQVYEALLSMLAIQKLTLLQYLLWIHLA